MRDVYDEVGQTFAHQDAYFDSLFLKRRVLRACIDQTGMGEKVVEDAQLRHGNYRVEGVLLIAAARAGRSKITVVIGAANGCALGNSGVTTSTGLLLPAVAGTSFTLDTSAALYGACTSTTTVSAAEQY